MWEFALLVLERRLFISYYSPQHEPHPTHHFTTSDPNVDSQSHLRCERWLPEFTICKAPNEAEPSRRPRDACGSLSYRRLLRYDVQFASRFDKGVAESPTTAPHIDDGTILIKHSELTRSNIVAQKHTRL